MTGEQILDRLEELFGEDISAYAHRDFSEAKDAPYNPDLDWEVNQKNILDFMGLGEIVETEQKGGSDEGSNWYIVNHFVDHDVYIRTSGYYQSYSGTDFHNGIGSVVTPQQKTITVFE